MVEALLVMRDEIVELAVAVLRRLSVVRRRWAVEEMEGRS